MSTIETVSLIATIASLILAIVAIWLSITFFRMSSDASKATTNAAEGIGASVERLENIFDKLYSDTFSMMRETVTDMRKHIWSKPISTYNDLSDEVKREIEGQVASAIAQSRSENSVEVDKLATKLNESVQQILAKTRRQDSALSENAIISALRERGPMSVKNLAELLNTNDDNLALNYLFPLRELEEITWSGEGDRLEADTIIWVIGGRVFEDK